MRLCGSLKKRRGNFHPVEREEMKAAHLVWAICPEIPDARITSAESVPMVGVGGDERRTAAGTTGVAAFCLMGKNSYVVLLHMYNQIAFRLAPRW